MSSPDAQEGSVSYGSFAFDQQMVVDANGNPAVGGDFFADETEHARLAFSLASA